MRMRYFMPVAAQGVKNIQSLMSYCQLHWLVHGRPSCQRLLPHKKLLPHLHITDCTFVSHPIFDIM